MFTSICLTLAIIFLSTNCQNNSPKSTTANNSQESERALAVAILPPTLEKAPPIVDQLLIKKLDQPTVEGNNVLLFAQFSGQEAAKAKEAGTLTLTLEGDKRIKFADNGQNGDVRAGDGVFTAPFKVDETELTKLIGRDNEIIAKKQGVETIFVGRSATKRKLTLFKLDSFRRGIPVLFDIAFTSIVDATTLPGIRDNSLMITNTSVVEDKTRTYDPCMNPKGNPNGVWSFKTLVANMANGFSTPEQFLTNWVDNFLFSVNTLPSTDATTNRLPSKERLIRAWLKNCNITLPLTGLPATWQTDVQLKAEEFPVRLLAIVNRLDLRGNSGYGGFSNAGEGRFVFCFVDSNAGCTNGNNGPGTMTFILEYGVPISNCAALQTYATKWWNLRTGISNTILESITNTFTATNANPARPNKSALNHFRTNDFLSASVNLSLNPWDIRDFEIDATTHKLKIIHPNKEPMERSNGFGFPPSFNVIPDPAKQTALVAFVNGLPITLANPSPPYTIPSPLEGIHAPMRILPSGTHTPPSRYHWRGITTPNVMIPINRREFSLNTCSGCHKGETRNDFTHIRPRNASVASKLSGFMNGIGPLPASDDNASVSDIDTDPVGSYFVNDPGPTPLTNQKEFNEALRRAIDLEKLVSGSPCSPLIGLPRDLIAINHILKFRPINMEH